MMPNSFVEVQSVFVEGVDYLCRAWKRRSRCVLLSIHGGNLEPGTSEIAAEASAKTYSLFDCSLVKRGDFFDMFHVPSVYFDQKDCVDVVTSSVKAIAIHGELSEGEAILVGGLCEKSVAIAKEVLSSAGYKVSRSKRFPGQSSSNICNRCKSGKGLQLELPLGLRRQLFVGGGQYEREGKTDEFFRLVRNVRTIVDSIESYDFSAG